MDLAATARLGCKEGAGGSACGSAAAAAAAVADAADAAAAAVGTAEVCMGSILCCGVLLLPSYPPALLS